MDNIATPQKRLEIYQVYIVVNCRKDVVEILEHTQCLADCASNRQFMHDLHLKSNSKPNCTQITWRAFGLPENPMFITPRGFIPLRIQHPAACGETE